METDTLTFDPTARDYEETQQRPSGTAGIRSNSFYMFRSLKSKIKLIVARFLIFPLFVIIKLLTWREINEIEVERIRFPVADLHPSLDGFKIVHLSDFHADVKSASESDRTRTSLLLRALTSVAEFYKREATKLSPYLLEKAIELTNAEQPDAIMLTGDFVDKDPDCMHLLARSFAKLRTKSMIATNDAEQPSSPQPQQQQQQQQQPPPSNNIFAVLGNHDDKMIGAKDAITAELTRTAGIRVLKNEMFVIPVPSSPPSSSSPKVEEAAVIAEEETAATSSSSSAGGHQHQGHQSNLKRKQQQQNKRKHPSEESNAIKEKPGLVVVGFGDVNSRDFRPHEVMDSIAAASSPLCNVPRIGLSHNPDTAEALSRWRLDLVLSGHTHGGQICVPTSLKYLVQYLWAWISELVSRYLWQCIPTQQQQQQRKQQHCDPKKTDDDDMVSVSRSGYIEHSSSSCSSISKDNMAATATTDEYNDNTVPVLALANKYKQFIPRLLRIRHIFLVKNWHWASGLHRVIEADAARNFGGEGVNNYVYTTRGIGTHPPLRFFCRPELTVIELVVAAPTQRR